MDKRPILTSILQGLRSGPLLVIPSRPSPVFCSLFNGLHLWATDPPVYSPLTLLEIYNFREEYFVGLLGIPWVRRSVRVPSGVCSLHLCALPPMVVASNARS